MHTELAATQACLFSAIGFYRPSVRMLVLDVAGLLSSQDGKDVLHISAARISYLFVHVVMPKPSLKNMVWPQLCIAKSLQKWNKGKNDHEGDEAFHCSCLHL